MTELMSEEAIRNLFRQAERRRRARRWGRIRQAAWILAGLAAAVYVAHLALR